MFPVLQTDSLQSEPPVKPTAEEDGQGNEGLGGGSGSVWFVEAPKDEGAGVAVNPSRGPAPPSASTRSAFRLAGKPPPHTRPYGAPLSAGGGLCNTLQPGRF